MDMRRLASLFIAFKQVPGAEQCHVTGASSMLVRSHFHVLEEAINVRCAADCDDNTDSGGMKAGLKIAYYSLLKKMAKVVKVTHLERNEDDKAAEIDKFTDVLALNHNFIFGDALYQINKSRQTKLRRPKNLPKEEDCQQLHDYTISRIRELTGDEYRLWMSTDFCEL